MMIQGRVEVSPDWLIAPSSLNLWLARAFSVKLVTHRRQGSTDVTITLCAPKQITLLQSEGSRLTRVATLSLHIVPADTLTRLSITLTDRVNGSSPIAFTIDAAVFVMIFQIPEQVFALITNPARHSLLAFAQFTRRDGGTSFEVLRNTGRVTITLLTSGVVVESFSALVTL
jgi:hypothetical protein